MSTGSWCDIWSFLKHWAIPVVKAGNRSWQANLLSIRIQPGGSTPSEKTCWRNLLPAVMLPAGHRARSHPQSLTFKWWLSCCIIITKPFCELIFQLYYLEWHHFRMVSQSLMFFRNDEHLLFLLIMKVVKLDLHENAAWGKYWLDLPVTGTIWSLFQTT